MGRLSIKTARLGINIRLMGDTTVYALAHFYYGKALVAYGLHERAFRHLDIHHCNGHCTPAIALCRQPSAEHRRYLQELVDTGVDLNCLDKRAYSAMDYAVFFGDTRAESILAAGLKSQFGGDEQKVTLVQDRARLRKGYREIFQEKLRPILLHLRPASPHRLRCVYAEALDADADKQRLFDRLKYLPYADFSFRRLPRSSDRLHRPFTPATDDGKYIIFISYRWINKDPNPQSPDDTNNTQYKRMLDAIELFLQNRPEVDKEKLCIWMVSLSHYVSKPEADQRRVEESKRESQRGRTRKKIKDEKGREGGGRPEEHVARMQT